MNSNYVFAIFPIISFLCYIAPVIFFIWFLLKFLKVQNERNHILKSLSDKLDILVKPDMPDKLDEQENLNQEEKPVILEKQDEQHEER